MRNNKPTEVIFVGMRVKVRLPSQRCGLKTKSQHVWLKGKITKIDCANAITLSVWSKQIGRMDGIMCVRDKKDGCFRNVVAQENRHNKKIVKRYEK